MQLLIITTEQPEIYVSMLEKTKHDLLDLSPHNIYTLMDMGYLNAQPNEPTYIKPGEVLLNPISHSIKLDKI